MPIFYFFFFSFDINRGISIPGTRLTIVCEIKSAAGKNSYKPVLEEFPIQKRLTVANLEVNSSSELHTR